MAKKSTSVLEITQDEYLQRYNTGLRRQVQEMGRGGLPLLPLLSVLPPVVYRRGDVLHLNPDCSSGATSYSQRSAGVTKLTGMGLGDLANVCEELECGGGVLTLDSVRYLHLGQMLLWAAADLAEAGVDVPWYTGNLLTPERTRAKAVGWLDTFHQNRPRTLARKATQVLQSIRDHLETQEGDHYATLGFLVQEALDAPWPAWDSLTLSRADHFRLVGSLLEEELDLDATVPGHTAIMHLHRSVRDALVQRGDRNWENAQRICRTLVSTSVPSAPTQVSALMGLPLPEAPVSDPYAYLLSTWQEQIRTSIQTHADTLLEGVRMEAEVWMGGGLSPRVLHIPSVGSALLEDVIESHPNVRSSVEGTFLLVHPLLADALLHGSKDQQQLAASRLTLVGELQCGGDTVHPASGATSGDLAALEILARLWTPGDAGPSSDMATALSMAIDLARE